MVISQHITAHVLIACQRGSHWDHEVPKKMKRYYCWKDTSGSKDHQNIQDIKIRITLLKVICYINAIFIFITEVTLSV